MNYSSISIQGNILTSEILEKIRTEDIRYQAAKEFGLDPRVSVRDEISLAWSLAVSHWNAFKQKRDKLSSSDTGTTDTRNQWMKPLFLILGYDIAIKNAEEINGKLYAISFRASNIDQFPVHIVGINQPLDSRPATGGISPHALVQEYLNNQEHLYALVSNGKFLRLLRDATRLSRLSYLEFNLEQMMEEQLYAEFALLYRVLHSSRMPQNKDAGADSIIEFYHQEALASGSRIRERLSIAVETSIKELANGLLQNSLNEELRTAIAKGSITSKDYYTYNLRLIYRMLFLMVIEERKLIYSAERNADLDQLRNIYYNYYSVQRLGRLVEKVIYVDPRKSDLWQSLITCFLLFEECRHGKSLGITPLGSGLFAPDALGPLKEQALDNETFIHVLQHLVTFENENGQRVRVNYADLDVEEFGSVYEGLLEYEPEIQNIETTPQFLFQKGTERSKSGSHYTPEELVKPLIKHSLDYLIEDKLKDRNPEAALLSLKVCDVACGSGHILLSAARRIGFELAKLRSKEDQPSPIVLRKAIRDTIVNCIYGVDKNPLAVELCKVAMWLEAHTPGEPLNFLDHHIKCGDAILGLAQREELEHGIANEAFKTLPQDEKAIAAAFMKRNKEERSQKEQTSLKFEASVDNEIEAVIERYKLFKNLPERTPEEVARKETEYHGYEKDYHRIRLHQLADAQVAQFFIPKSESFKSYVLTDSEYRNFLRQVNKHLGVLQSHKLTKAEIIAKEKMFFHWFLEFPEVFKEGGFDCILGNPPFLGGRKISSSFGDAYLNWLLFYYTPAGGQADFVSYFFRRIYNVLRAKGFQSLIATKTIAEGDTRNCALLPIFSFGANICFVVKSIKWPGVAALQVSLVTIFKGKWYKNSVLDGRIVKIINSRFEESQTSADPKILSVNEDIVFKGSSLLGDGFIITKEVAGQLTALNSKNLEVLQPILNGNDINEQFEIGRTSNYVINFKEWPITKAKLYPDCFKILENTVAKQRKLLASKSKVLASLAENFWIFERTRKKLYTEVAKYNKCYVVSLTTKFLSFISVKPSYVFTQALYVVIPKRKGLFAFIQSTIHSEWAWQNSSTMGSSTLRYTPTSAFQTFPFPESNIKTVYEDLESLGDIYHEHRRKLMLSMKLGLTKTYNAFHAEEIKGVISSATIECLDKKVIERKYGKEIWNLWNHLSKTPNSCNIEHATSGIIKLRELHMQMDNKVLEAYGWIDIQLRHNFYKMDYLPENDHIRFTIHPDARKEVLKRLLELNHKIHEQEVKAGLWDNKGKKKKSSSEEEMSEVNEGEVDFGLFKK
jgi:hypothetical protein